ncbi:MAG: HEAT repeat domain-containing protein, partial [Fuerstia sp.]|nr:HEAT repeat domain-containing protein [Fuerstiella sp.]
MNAVVRVVSMIVALLPSLCSNAQQAAQITLDSATREKCLSVLRAGLRGEEFWPSIHAAEGLSLEGHGLEVIEYLKPKLKTETDDQKLCGIAREIARAGDRSAIPVMLNILEGENDYGHVHAAESLFKIFEAGDGLAMQRAESRRGNVKLKVMAAGALARCRVPSSIQTVRDVLKYGEPEDYGIAAWVLGQIGDSSDIPRLKAQLPHCPDAATRANFEHALAVLGDADGLQSLQKNLTRTDNAIRTYAATFAGDARATATVDRLKAMLEDPFPDARIRAAQSLLVLAGPAVLPFKVHASAVFKELNASYCWFHPRVAAIPGHGSADQPAVVMTIQKHLGVSDHYSGLYYLRTNDLGQTWTGPTEIPELASRPGENGETIAACDVTPGWLTHSEKILAIGVKLRYGPKGEQLVDKPKSHECAYATYDPKADKWTAW